MPPSDRSPTSDRPPSYDPSKPDYAGISSAYANGEEDIHAAREFAEMIVDAVRESLLVLDLDLRVKAANESFYDTFGVTAEETQGHLVYEIGKGQWDIPELRRLLEDILPENKTFNDYEVEHDVEGGGHRVMLLNARQMDDHQLILLALEDVTERRSASRSLSESEARQAFLLTLTDALRPLVDPVEIQAVAARVLGEHLGASRVHYGEFVEEGAFVEIGDDYRADVPSVAGRVGLGAFSPAPVDVIRSGRTLVVCDVAEDDLVDPEGAATALFGVGAYIVVPLLKQRRAVAALAVHHPTPRTWTEEEVARVEETAERTWAAVERAKAEAALRASEDRYRTLFTSMDQGFGVCEVIFDGEEPVDFRWLVVNPQFEPLTGLSEGEVLSGKTIREVMPDLEESWFQIYGRVARTGESVRFEGHSPRLGRWFDVYAFQVGEPHERHVAVLFTNITVRKRAEAELRSLNEELEARVEERTRQVRRLASTLTMAEQEERRRLSQILHDDLQQILFGVRLKLSVARERLEAAGLEADQAEALREVVAVAEERLQRAGEITRTLTVDLSPPILKTEGLRDVLDWLRIQMKDLYDLDVTVEAEESFRTPEEDLRVLLFQVIRELLFNVTKHAGTNEVLVTLRRLDHHVQITVADEGEGFDVEAAAAREAAGEGPTGFGLFSVRERLGLFGGRMRIESAPGEGTQVVLDVPLRLE